MQSARVLVLRRTLKQINKHVKDSTPTAVNHQAGRNVLTRSKDDHFKGAKKSDTLAYPEDALIDVSNSTEVIFQLLFQNLTFSELLIFIIFPKIIIIGNSPYNCRH